jgi:hypothetical protein
MLAEALLVAEPAPFVSARILAAATVEGRNAGVLRTILCPDVNLAVWHRTLDATLVRDAVLLSERRFKGIDFIVAPDAQPLLGVPAPTRRLRPGP